MNGNELSIRQRIVNCFKGDDIVPRMAIDNLESLIIQERIDEVRMFREAMTFSNTTPSIYEPNRIAELKYKQEQGKAA